MEERTFAPDVFNYSANSYDSYDQQPTHQVGKDPANLRFQNEKRFALYDNGEQENMSYDNAFLRKQNFGANYQNVGGSSFQPYVPPK